MTRVWRKDKRIIKNRKNFLRKQGLILNWITESSYATISGQEMKHTLVSDLHHKE